MKITFFLFLLFLGINIQAQLVTTDSYMPKSPNAATLDKTDNSQMQLATGGMQVSFNLYTIRAGKINIPITLSYHSGGIKVDELPTIVGLGWSLSSGASISRQIKGNPDEGMQINKEPRFYIVNKTTGQYGKNYKNNNCENTYEEAVKGVDTNIYYIKAVYTNALYNSMLNGIGSCLALNETLNDFYSAIVSHNEIPDATDNLVSNHPGYFSSLRDEASDEYTVHLPDYCGNFSCNNQGDFLLNADDKDLKIQSEKVIYENDYIYNPYIKRWTVLSTNGLKYYFGDTANSVAYTDAFMENRGILNNSTVTEWNASKIIDQNSKDTVYFSYDKNLEKVGFGNILKISFNSFNYNPQNLDMDIAGSGNIISGFTPAIKTIQSKNESVSFYYSKKLPDRALWNVTTLDSIVVTERYSGQMIKKIIFNYDVFNMSKKIKLTSLMEVSNDRKKALVTGFDYYDTTFTSQIFTTSNTTQDTIQYTRRAKDYWGYYNHKLKNYSQKSPNAEMIFSGSTTEHLISDDRRPAWPYMQLSVLTAINYPSGAKTVFEYEPHSASSFYALENEDYLMNFDDYDSQVCPFSFDTIGGLRIKKIIQLSENKIRSIKLYDYNNENKISSGHLNITPSTIIKVSGTKNFGIPGYDNYILSENNKLSRFGATAEVNYAMVTEYDIDSSGASNGYIIHHFYNDANTLDKNFFTNYYDDSYVYPTFPMSSFNMPYWLGGTRKGINLVNGYEKGYAVYDKDSNKFQEHINEYSVIKKPSVIINKATRVFGNPVFYGMISNTPNHTITGISSSLIQISSYIDHASYTIQALNSTLGSVQTQMTTALLNGDASSFYSLQNMYNSLSTAIEIEENSIAVYGNQNISSTLTVGYIGSPLNPLLYYLDNNITFYKRAVLSKSKNWNYDLSGNSLVTEQNNYYESPYHHNSTRNVQYNSKGDSVITIYNYAFDFADNINGDTVCSQMKNLYFNPIISSLQYKRGNMVDGEVALYNNFSTNSTPAIYPVSLYVHKYISGSASGNMSRVYPINSYFSDNNFELLSSYTYNSTGNLLQEKRNNNFSTSFVWGYRSQYPVVKISGSDYSIVNSFINNQSLLDNPQDDNTLRNYLNTLRTNLPNALINTYTYKPLIGMTSETDPSGKITYYNYDRYNRLNLLIDKNKNILKRTDYVYCNETDAPLVPQVIYYNHAVSVVFSKNNCGTGYTGGGVSYSVSANKYSSVISQSDVDAQAQNEINTNGQNYANAIGTCNPVITYITVTSTNSTGYSSVKATLTNVNTNQIYTFSIPANGGILGSVPSGTYNISFSDSKGNYLSYGVCGYWESGDHNATFNNIILDSSCSELEVDWL